MKKIMSKTIALAVAVLIGVSLTNAAPTVFAVQDDHAKMGNMNMKKSGAGSAKKKPAKKKAASRKSAKTKKKPAQKKSNMGNMKMNNMD
jgi:myosin-crossreactive antigen